MWSDALFVLSLVQDEFICYFLSYGGEFSSCGFEFGGGYEYR